MRPLLKVYINYLFIYKTLGLIFIFQMCIHHYANLYWLLLCTKVGQIQLYSFNYRISSNVLYSNYFHLNLIKFMN